MITRKFIEKVHNAFDELNYHETNLLNYGNFERSFVKTLTHCKELIDAKNTLSIYRFCIKKWGKIQKIFDRKLKIFNIYKFEGNSLISTVSNDEANSSYFITNCINGDVDEVFVASHSLGENLYVINSKGGKYTAFENGNYYIKYAKMSAVKMKLFNRNDKCLCNIVLSENLGIFLEENFTPYEIVVYDDFVGIYERSYINSLKDKDIIDTSKLLADIEWDMIDKKSDLGVAKLNIYTNEQSSVLEKNNSYKDNHELELFLSFAMSTFLIFQKYMSVQKRHDTLLKLALWS